MTSWFNSDKPWIAVDTTGGPYDGNVYLVFYSFQFYTKSTDGGKTFSNPILVTGGVLTGVTVDPSGAVFVVSEDSSGGILVSKSVDGGLSFSTAVVAASGLKPLSGLPGNGFRVSTFPQIAADNKGIYIAVDNNGTGSSDVLFIASTNGGQSWTTPLRIDPEANDQFDPSIAVSAGTISIVWYDSRMGQLSNGTITALDVYIAQSRNAGASFSPGIRVTSVSFDPNKVLRTDGPNTNYPFIGDYIEVAAIRGAVYPIWTDNRNACDTVDPVFGCVDQDVFTVPEKLALPISSLSSLDSSSVSISGSLLVDRLLPGVSGNLTVTAVNSSTGAPIFSRTYSVPSLPLTSVSGPANQALFGLNVPVMPYALSLEVKVILQGTSVTGSTLLTRELDINADGSVDIIDAGIAALSFGTSTGNPKYNPKADFLAHGTVDIVDLGVFAFYFNAPVFH
jgi:hypothetical protein